MKWYGLFLLLELNFTDGQFACFYGKKIIQLQFLVERKCRGFTNHTVVLERCSEHTEAANSSRNGLHIAARAQACPAASVFSVSQNHGMVVVGRELCGSSSPTLLPKQGHLQQAAQDLGMVKEQCF